MLRIYVGNLPYAVRDAELQAYFADAGCKVKTAVVPLDHSGRSKGFGFVEFEDQESMDKGLAMNEKEMGGRPLEIDAARPREDRNGGGSSAPRHEAPAAPKEESADAGEDMTDTDADTE